MTYDNLANKSSIVRYFERFVDREKSMIYIIMGGDLAAVIKRCRKEKRYIPEEVIWNLFAQLVLALNECHNSKTHQTILHRDIKPDNVFLGKEVKVKLGDFGLSRTVDDEFAKTYVGTPYYMSPELADDSHYNLKSDIWALACLIFELCSLEPPFLAKSHSQLVAKIKEGKTKRLPSQYSPELGEVITAMFTLNVEKRPCSQELLQHPRIKLAIREQELNDVRDKLKEKEVELQRRAAHLDKRAADLSDLETRLEKLEVDLTAKMNLVEAIKENTIIDTTMFISPAQKTPGTKLRHSINYNGSPGDASMLMSPSVVKRGTRVFQLQSLRNVLP